MNPSETIKILHELHVDKLAGKLDDSDHLLNDQIKWRNRLDYKLLEEYIRHSCKKIRILILNLLVDSKKSTLMFFEEELKIILLFIKFNLAEKLEFIPLIKKALKRLNSSWAVHKRNLFQAERFKITANNAEIKDQWELYQQRKQEYEESVNATSQTLKIYQSFFINIREECLNSIFMGATHTRKENSLLILQLQQEIWYTQEDDEIFEWTLEQAEKLYQCLLFDTYETNKDIAFKVLSKIKPFILQLENRNRVEEILNVSIKLANSMRPIDSITAAYILKLCILSPIIGEIIEDDWNVKSENDTAFKLICILLQQISEPTKLANINIIQAVSKHSLFGYIYCIKSIISTSDLSKVNNESWRKMISELINICLSLNAAVSSVVNNSSPEGHFPMDLNKKYLKITEEEIEFVKVTPQMVLLCSWRTVKETSLLFGHLIGTLPISDDDLEKGLLSEEQILKIGDHLVTLLCETKHRGAFEQAHVGFEQLCSRLWRLKNKRFNELPKVWLYQLLTAITGLAPGNSKFCATRRSAGVPFMVQALVTSDPSLKSKVGTVFHSIMRILLGLAEIEDEKELSIIAQKLINKEDFFSSFNTHQYADLCNYSSAINSGDRNDGVTIIEVKTHMLNILRALFKHTHLRGLAGIYAADGLIIAVKNYDKKTWAERNAATLLFSALITRIFGVQRTKDYVNLTVHNKMTGRVFFEKYPRLLPFMLDELQAFIDDQNNPIRPSIQSILLLLSRLYLSTNAENSNADWKIGQFIILVSTCAKSVVYTTRELAARAVVPLLTDKTVCIFLNQLFNNIDQDSRSSNRYRWNLMHGYILQALEVAKSNLLISCDLQEINLVQFITSSIWIVRDRYWINRSFICYPLAAAYIDLIYEFMKIHRHKSQYIPNSIFNQVLYESIKYFVNDDQKYQVGKEIFEYSTVKFFINWCLVLKLKYSFGFEEWLGIWEKILSHTNAQVQILGWSSVIETISQEFQKGKHDESFSNFNAQHSLISIAINQACNAIKYNIIDLDLYETVQEFLYQICIENEQGNLFNYQLQLNNKIHNIVLYSIEINKFYKNPSAFKLLGKVHGTVMKTMFSNHIQVSNWPENIQQLSSKIYYTFCNNSWTSTSTIGCRLAIAQVISDLYIDVKKKNWQHYRECILDWWTTLLHLTVDDSEDVREVGTLVLSNLKLCQDDTDNHNYRVLERFFKSFFNIFHDKNDMAFAAYFFWSTSMSKDDFQMDESDVFNKCYNYEAYEPLKLIEICIHYLQRLKKDNWSLQFIFSGDVQIWLSKKLDMPIEECKDVHTLISAYKKYVPQLNGNLYDILDPMYNDKILHNLAFEKIKIFINNNYR